MRITKCDICGKQLKEYKKEVGVTPPGKLSSLVFCLACGKPIIKFLEKHRLVEKQGKI